MNDVLTAAVRPELPRDRGGKVHSGWFISLALLAVLVFLMQATRGRAIDVSLAELAGRVTVIALFMTIGFILVGKVLGWIFLARRGREPARSPKLVAYLTFFAAIYFGAIVGDRAGDSARAKAITAIQAEMARFERESVDENGVPVRTTGPAPHATPAGKPATWEQLLREVLARSEAARNEYIAELDAIHWDTVLDPARIAQDTTLEQGREMVQEAERIVARHEARMAELFRSAREQIQALPLSAADKRSMLAGFDSSLASPKVADLQALERQSVAQIGDLVDTLAASKYGVGWRIEDGQIGFISDDAMNKYNAQIEALFQTIAKQEKLMAEKLHETKKGLAEM